MTVSGARIVVVGAGIAGLTTAYRIRQLPRERGEAVDVTVLEASERVGGNIRSERADGFTFEWGPNGFLDNVPFSVDLAHELGLEDELQPADERAATRYIWRKGKLHSLPTGPLSFLRSGVLSLAGRLRVLLEPLQPKGPVEQDESVRDFGSRRIGREAADVLIDAMVSGVFAGNAAELSLPSSFPKMRAMEAEHGSLLKAMVARRKQRTGGGPSGPGGTLTSFRGGMQTLPAALAERLGDSVRLGSPVSDVAPRATGEWVVRLESGEEILADRVVVTVPAPRALPMLRSASTGLAEVLQSMPTAGLAVVALGYRESDLGTAPDGFGFLVPRSEGLRMLGCLRDSSIFPGRAPEGHALLRVMIGGVHDPEAVRLSDEELLATVRGELQTTLGVTADPVAVRVFRHPLGIGQYTLGHGDRVAAVERALESLPGLSVTGSSYLGVSMNLCVENANRTARAVVDGLALGTPSPSSVTDR